MTTLYNKSRLGFALAAIGVYVMGASIADGLSLQIGYPKSLTLLFHIIYAALLLGWIIKNGLGKEYGLCRGRLPAVAYLILAGVSSVNLWFGLGMNMPLTETLLFIGSMLCVGFLEELIFRGLLFRAMEKDGLRMAIAVSSITFGIGHIVNLFNASGAALGETVWQIISAAAIGFFFVALFLKSGSLLPCIISHSFINCSSAFANPSAMTGWRNGAVSAGVSLLAFFGAIWLLRRKEN